MLTRVAYAFGLLALVFGAFLFLDTPRELPAVRANARFEPRSEREDLSEPGLTPAPLARSSPVALEPEAGNGRRDASAEVVRIRARIEPPGAALDWGGAWNFELQTWDAALETTELHARAADSAGSAEFEFDGPVHVDWVRVLPPEASGLALAFVEEHVDLEPGEVHEVVLTPGRGGRIRGRVVDLEGGPVAGARVHAYADDVFAPPDWQPGLVVAETDRSGRFRLPRLPAGEWSLCAEPGEWLGYSPRTGELVFGENLFTIRVDGDVDDARLTVLRTHPFTLRLIDASGAPVSAAVVRMQPLQLLGGRMLLAAPPQPDPLDAFLHGDSAADGAEPWIWPYGEMNASTDARGAARVMGLAGTWLLSVWPPAQSPESSLPVLSQRIELPSPDLVWTLTAVFERHRGRIEDERGEAIEGVWMALRTRGSSESLAVQRSDADGRFEFDWLRPGTLYEAVARRRGYITRVVEIAPTPPAAPPATSVLRSAVQLRLTLVDTAGEPIQRATLHLQAVRPDDLQPGEHAAVEVLERHGYLRSGSGGTVHLPDLPPGEIDLGLQRNFAVLDSAGDPMFEPTGQARVTQRLVHTWSLSVPPAEQRLVIDVSAWPEPRSLPLATHTGRVVDAATGAPIAGALLLLQSQSAFRRTYSDQEGRFELLGMAGPCELLARAEGYSARRIPARSWEPVEREHEFALSAGADTCEIVFEDRNGERLPTVRVTARDADGSLLRLVLRDADGDLGFESTVEAVRGRLSLLAPPPGILDLELEIPQVGPLGRCRVIVSDAGTAQELVVRLERSLAELRAELLAREGEDRR